MNETPQDRMERIQEENDVAMDYQYTTKDGVIVSPGKFEGEPAWLPYFYTLWNDGGADDEILIHGTTTAIFNIDASDVTRFPALAGVRQIYVWEDSQGFVRCTTTNYEEK